MKMTRMHLFKDTLPRISMLTLSNRGVILAAPCSSMQIRTSLHNIAKRNIESAGLQRQRALLFTKFKR